MPIKRSSLRMVALVGLLLPSLTSCSMRPPPIKVPSMDPEGAGAQAIAEFDADKDGAIAGDELDACPGIRAGLAMIDQDRDRRVTAEEIAERVRGFQRAKAGLMILPCTVTLDGRPLAEATVTLIPETFLGGGILPATGTTDAGGGCQFETEGMDIRGGVQCGLFRVEVSKKDPTGKEILPHRYNTETILGVDVGTDSPAYTFGLQLELQSDK